MANYVSEYTGSEIEAALTNAMKLNVSPPATLSSSGTEGQWACDGDYIYYCTDTDTWVKTKISDNPQLVTAYTSLTGLPSINSVTLTGNKTGDDLSLVSASRMINGHNLSADITLSDSDFVADTGLSTSGECASLSYTVTQVW